MIRTIEFPLTKLYPDWHSVRVQIPNFIGGDTVRDLAKVLEEHDSDNRFGILGTGSINEFIVYFEDRGDAVWYALTL